jgi:hypothetical protein
MIKHKALLLALSTFLFASLEAGAQVRKRTSRFDASTAQVTGVVVDEASGIPVFDAIVSAARKSVRAGADGRFQLSGLPSGATVFTISRWGYDDKTQTINLQQGANDARITLKSRPNVTLVKKGGPSYVLDYDAAGIASRGPLSGNVLLEPIDFCLGNGEVRNVEKKDLKSIRASSSAFDKTKCCPDSTGTVVTVTLRSGESFEGLVRDCIYYAVDFIGRNRADGKAVYLPMAEVESAIFD